MVPDAQPRILHPAKWKDYQGWQKLESEKQGYFREKVSFFLSKSMQMITFSLAGRYNQTDVSNNIAYLLVGIGFH